MADTRRRVGICGFIDAERAMDRPTPVGPASNIDQRLVAQPGRGAALRRWFTVEDAAE